jgi:hypothetical protein
MRIVVIILLSLFRCSMSHKMHEIKQFSPKKINKKSHHNCKKRFKFSINISKIQVQFNNNSNFYQIYKTRLLTRSFNFATTIENELYRGREIAFFCGKRVMSAASGESKAIAVGCKILNILGNFPWKKEFSSCK